MLDPTGDDAPPPAEDVRALAAELLASQVCQTLGVATDDGDESDARWSALATLLRRELDAAYAHGLRAAATPRNN